MPALVVYNGEPVANVLVRKHGSMATLYDTNSAEADSDVVINNTLISLDITEQEHNDNFTGVVRKRLSFIGFRQFLGQADFVSITAQGLP